jgi:uncharacterized ferritin-like protein (DUF455 family)
MFQARSCILFCADPAIFFLRQVYQNWPIHAVFSMSSTNFYLRGEQPRARWKRLDTAHILKRFYFCERSLIVGASAWIPHLDDLDIKMGVPYFCWQNAETANDLRERVFELRFPSRMIEHEGADRPLAELLAKIRNAPTAAAFLTAWGSVALAALRDAYQEFLDHSDPLADAPTHRFLELSVREKEKQMATLAAWAAQESARDLANRNRAENWIAGFSDQLAFLGGIGTDAAPPDVEVTPIPGSQSVSVPDLPARDARYWSCRFYWPDIVDAGFPYGEGLLLQLRSAVSHLNEVWAVEHGGIILSEFSDVLPWEWIRDAARWTYDESRHCRMGQNRLAAWGFDPSEVPLGTYIYESAKGAEPIYRLGMLYFFETKNIGRKPERTAVFKEIGDAASEHDMDFDWADETIHATYGNHWLRILHELNPEKYPAAAKVRDDCEFLVKRMIASATAAEKSAITERARKMIQRANELARQ